jgi:putative membrane protein
MSLMLTLHIIFLTTWSASLLYFPQLIIHEACGDTQEKEQQAVRLQRTLYALIMTPSAVLTVIAGGWLIFERNFIGGWLPVKLALVLLMAMFHAYCGTLMVDLEHHRVRDRLYWYRALPLIPAVLITGAVTLVVWKPF